MQSRASAVTTTHIRVDARDKSMRKNMYWYVICDLRPQRSATRRVNLRVPSKHNANERTLAAGTPKSGRRRQRKGQRAAQGVESSGRRGRDAADIGRQETKPRSMGAHLSRGPSEGTASAVGGGGTGQRAHSQSAGETRNHCRRGGRPNAVGEEDLARATLTRGRLELRRGLARATCKME